MPSSKPKTVERKNVPILVLLLVLIGTTVLGGLYIRSQVELVRTAKSLSKSEAQIRELAGQVARTNEVIPAAPVVPEPSAVEGLPEETQSVLHQSFPFPASSYQAVRELTPDLLVAIIGPTSASDQWWTSQASVWLLDLNTQEPRRLFSESSAMNESRFWLNDWSGGLVIERQSSPGEAVADIYSAFIDRAGKLVAEVERGSYERPLTTMDARFNGRSFSLELVQKTRCVQPDWSREFVVPTTTLTGIRVNGRLSALPTELNVSCTLGYGDSISDVAFPDASFDGKSVVFRLPGYDVALSSIGALTYTQRTAYRISDGFGSLIREDRTGERLVMKEIFVDPLLKDFAQAEYYFRFKELIGSNAMFAIQKYERDAFGRRTILVNVGTVGYNVNLGKFENLLYTTDESEGHQIEPCGTTWSSSLQRLQQGDKEAVDLVEGCIQARGYPFKKFPIPGVSGGYLAFMGNGSSTVKGLEGPVCEIDGQSQSCLLYRVIQGQPTVLASSSDETHSLRQIQPVASLDNRSMVVRLFPYEVCSFSAYRGFDFIANTSTGDLIGFTPDGSCADKTMIEFSPTKNRTVQLELEAISRTAAFPKTKLLFEGVSIGEIEGRLSEDWERDEHAFPKETDLAGYALQANKMKFFFLVGEKSYVLDFSSAVPKLSTR